jgi:CTP:molybdopterin cytidylyltransferase MocA
MNTVGSSDVVRGKRCVGLILAGGMGRRWGGPKAFARLPDGRTFLEACRDVLTSGGARPIVATLPHGIEIEEIGGVRSLPLPEPELDMLASIRWGLRHLISDTGWQAVVILPVDHPLVHLQTVSELASTDAPAAIPVYHGKHGHPILLSRKTAEGVARGDLGGPTLREAMKEVGAIDVPVNDAGINANCNTPETLKDSLKNTNR